MAKIVELFIDDEEEMAGGDAIAMVQRPAHETDFVAFNQEKKSEEDAKEIILTDEEQEKVLQQFNSMGEDHQSFMMKGYYIKSVEPVDISPNFIKEKFAATNINARPIKDVLDDKSVMDYEDPSGKYKVRFRYAVRPGRPAIINTTRQFCKDMINANKTYRLEDINKVVNGFQQYGQSSWGNSFFRFGGPNCNHVWVKIVYQQMFDKKGAPTGKYKTVSEQDRGDAANIAGSNLNEATANNPSPQTIRRAGQGMFSAEEIQKFNEELKKQYLMAGPVLIPDKLIYRVDPNTREEYYVYFSKESVKKIAFKYMRDKNTTNTNIEHNPNQAIDNVSLVESWIVDDPENDKSNQYGFKCEPGTWFGVVDCSKNQQFYNEYVENGKVLGFSLEGYFESKLVKFYENEKKHSNINVETYILSEIENILNK